MIFLKAFKVIVMVNKIVVDDQRQVEFAFAFSASNRKVPLPSVVEYHPSSRS